jgi:glycosidase
MEILKMCSGEKLIRFGWWLMRRGVLLLMILSMVFAGMSCSKDDGTTPEPTPVVTDEEPKQYDVPFTNVPATEKIIMYEVNLWAFSQAGNLEGVKARLDHLQDLGVNVVWLMPIYEIGELKGIGSPYAIRNYKKINPAFGTLENLRSLVKEAHARDMAVILDWVGNHTSWDSPWIQNPTWYTRDASGNIISPQGMGWNDVADLNFGSSAMRKEMIKAMKYWVLEANVDGFRCDYATGVPTDFWKQAIDTLRNIPNRELIMFAESDKKEMLGAGFDLIFGWNFYGKLKEVYENNASVNNVVSANTSDYVSVPQGKHILRWISNHDDNAWDDTPANIFNGQPGAMAAFVVTAYMGGVPLIYNGQEVGFNTKLPFFQNSSVKIDWNLNPDILQQYIKLVNFRKNSLAATNGTLETFHTSDVMGFKRKSGDEELVVIVNLRNQAKDFALPASLTNSEWTNVVTDQAVPLNTSLSLQPYEYLVLTK